MKKILVVILILVVGVVSEAGKGNWKTPSGQAKKELVVTEPIITKEGEEEAEGVKGLEESGGRSTYILVPKEHEDLYIIGMDSSGTKYGYGLSEEEKVNNFPVETIEINEKEYCGDVKLLEVLLKSDKGIKLVVGYKVSGNNKYVLLSSDAINDRMLEVNYKNGDGLRIIKLEDYIDYSEFPGYEVEEVVMTGIRVGKEEMIKSNNPSNIIKKFGPVTSGEAIGVNILPSASWSQFHIYALKGGKTYGLKSSGQGNDYKQIEEDLVVKAKESSDTPQEWRFSRK